MKVFFAQHARIYVCIAAFFVLLALILWSVVGLNPSPEFSGSARLVVEVDADLTAVTDAAGEAVVTQGDSGTQYILTEPAIGATRYTELLTALRMLGDVAVVSFESFSPSVSEELIRKSFIALGIASLIIIFFVAFAFSSVSRPVSSWKYGVVATVALAHDVLIPVGLFALLGVYGVLADTLFVTALLAVIGYSVNDTIVVFDRIRDHLRSLSGEISQSQFVRAVEEGVASSVRRALYTSLTTMAPLVFLAFLVPVTRWFGVTLFVGILAGTYSSLFLAPSLLTLWHRFFPQKQEREEDRTDTERAEDELLQSLRAREGH